MSIDNAVNHYREQLLHLLECYDFKPASRCLDFFQLWFQLMHNKRGEAVALRYGQAHDQLQLGYLQQERLILKSKLGECQIVWLNFCEPENDLNECPRKTMTLCGHTHWCRYVASFTARSVVTCLTEGIRLCLTEKVPSKWLQWRQKERQQSCYSAATYWELTLSLKRYKWPKSVVDCVRR